MQRANAPLNSPYATENNQGHKKMNEGVSF